MLLAALVSLLAALEGSGLGTLGFTMAWGLGSYETIGFTLVSGPPGREVTWWVVWLCDGFGGQGRQASNVTAI